MSVTLHRITYSNSNLGDEGAPIQEWYSTHAKAAAAIRLYQDTQPDFSAVIEEFNVSTGARQLCCWLNQHCGLAKAVTPGPQSKAA